MKHAALLAAAHVAAFAAVVALSFYAAVAKGAEPFRLMSAQRDAQFRGLLPRIDEPTVDKMLDDPRLILYTEAEIPRAYQFWVSVASGFHDPNYNISADPAEHAKGNGHGGNANAEFPWQVPAGTEHCEGVKTFKFLWLPVAANGRPYPVAYWRAHLTRPPGADNSGPDGYRWTYPIGTRFGEVLYRTHADGIDRTFEIRLRTREADDWGVEVYRPFSEPKQMAAAIERLRPRWQQDDNLRGVMASLDKPRRRDLLFWTLQDTNHPSRQVVKFAGSLEFLPPIEDRKLVRELLDVPFQATAGIPWRKVKNGPSIMAPSARDGLNIVPANYTAGCIAIDSDNCRKCHEGVNQNVAHFHLGRDWYGQVRGSDGIFSFHPVERSSISPDGGPRPVQIRRDMLDAGIVAAYDPGVHKAARYKTNPKFGE